MNKKNFLILIICIEISLILAISIANIFEGVLYYLFYNGIFGLLLSTILPILFLFRNKEKLSSVGIKKVNTKQLIVLFLFVIFSVAGQLVPLILNGVAVEFNLLPICIFPMIMTTFFEEFLFRGFIQTRVENLFGWLPAILISGLLFSLYHFGYPGFRNINDLILLFAVGVGFATAYKVSNNNLFVAYFVNLPNAFITYVLKSGQFPLLTIHSSIFAFASIVLVIITLGFASRKLLQMQ